MTSPTQVALARGILDATVIELRSTASKRGGYDLTEDALRILERHCATLCAEHLSLDHNALRIVRAGVLQSKDRSLHESKYRYAVAFSITSDNCLFRFTLYDGATGKGSDAFKPNFKKMTRDRIVFSVFFQVSTIAELKDEPAPQIIVTPSKEDQHHAAYPA
jgi:hypothetical protein